MEAADAETITLGRQLLAAAGMMLAVTLTHALGLMCISRTLRLRSERLEQIDFSWRTFGLGAGMALLLLLLHSVQIAMFAGFYLYIGVMTDLEDALYYSASAYTTLGRTADTFPETWRLIGAIEALIGFLMLGWTTAFMVRKINRLMPD